MGRLLCKCRSLISALPNGFVGSHRMRMRPIVRCLVVLLVIHQVGCARFEVMRRSAVYYRRGKRDITFPGTKWCGPGSRAANFSDLGDESETDKCCREHDHCPESIPGYSWKHGLHNPTPYTRSHCYCDEAFRRCLEDVKSKVGNLMAEIYFNFLRVKCFKQDCPVVRCIKHSGSRPQRNCIEYKMDCTKPRIWQFFDARNFETI